MDRQEAVQKPAAVEYLSTAHAEGLYDAVVPRPVIPYYIADYIEEVKSKGDYTVVGAVNEAPDGRVSDWLFLERVNIFAQAWVNGYIVEDEPRYTVKMKNKAGDEDYLVNTNSKGYRFYNGIYTQSRVHTRKELEDADFGWVFDCPGLEVKEVTDE